MSLILDEKEGLLLTEDLRKLGLSEKEALVYLSLLRHGESGSSKIITDTGLHGQYVYQALESLEGRGLTQHVIKRGRKKFSAKSPTAIARLIDQQKLLADSLVGKLEKLMVLPQEQQFEVYQGKESYIAHEFDLLEKAEEGSELLVIGGTGDQFYETMGERLNTYDSLRRKKSISIRYIGSEGQRATLAKTHGKREKFEIKLLPGLFTGSVNTNVWPDSLGFNIYGEPVTRFTITSTVVAGSYRQFFETLWKMARQ
ncbi:MAG: helix-turn-helix domain-containing protein [Patescibacteria group bacterium]